MNVGLYPWWLSAINVHRPSPYAQVSHLHHAACWLTAKHFFILQVLVWDSCHSCASKAAVWPLKIKLLSCFWIRNCSDGHFKANQMTLHFGLGELWPFDMFCFAEASLSCYKNHPAVLRQMVDIQSSDPWASKYRSQWFINCKIAWIWYCAFDNHNTLCIALLKAA